MSTWTDLTEEEVLALKEREEELNAWEEQLKIVPMDSPAISTSATKGLTEPELKFLLLRHCKNKKELRNWIKTFLHQDLPDQTVDPDSNSNPLDMVWRLYQTAIWYDDLLPADRYIKSVFYCSRGSFKTLSLCIAELMIMMHSGRNTVHIGLIESQAKNAYQMYFRQFLDKPYIKDWIKINSILERSELNHQKVKDDGTFTDALSTTLQVIPLTMNKTSSPRANFVAKDEVDKVKGEQVQAYENAYGMLTTTNDKKMAMEVDISSRDSAFGKVQDLIDNAEKTGTKVHHWNRIDITERCPDERSGRVPTKYYVKTDTLITINEEDYDDLSSEEKPHYQMQWGLDGCNTNCKIFAACRGFLKNQRSKSKWLKTIESTQQDLLSAPSEEMAIAQLLCKLPPKTGLVYSDFDKKKNVKTPAQMYEIAFHKPPGKEKYTTEDLISDFTKAGFDGYAGADAGFHHPAALLLFIDPRENVYVVKEHMPEEVDSEEMAQWLKDNWKQYEITRFFVDPESPDLTRFIKKRGFNVSSKVDKKVQPGLATVKGFIRRPATQITQLYVNSECMGMLYEFSRYSYKLGTDGKPTDKPKKELDHSMDTLRYILHTLFGKARGNTNYASEKKKDKSYEEALANINRDKLNPTSVAAILGQTVVDNRHILDEISEDQPKKKTTTGFDWGDM